jgi:8-oxo-dGTP diphosphatase
MTRSRETVQAAGAVLWRRRKGDTEVALVHRPKYDDWSFPKGKREVTDADDAMCAQREVTEETGYETELGGSLPSTTYRDAKHRPKRVHYWSMRLLGGEFTPNAEVDEVRWLAPDEARALLTYAHDRTVLDAFTALLVGAPRP